MARVVRLAPDRHAGGLYLLTEVGDPTLDRSNTNARERAPVEKLIGPGNGRACEYPQNDARYRIGYTNDAWRGPAPGRSERPTTVRSGAAPHRARVPWHGVVTAVAAPLRRHCGWPSTDHDRDRHGH